MHRDLKLGNIVLNRRYALYNFIFMCKDFLEFLEFENPVLITNYLFLFFIALKKLQLQIFVWENISFEKMTCSRISEEVQHTSVLMF